MTTGLRKCAFRTAMVFNSSHVGTDRKIQAIRFISCLHPKNILVICPATMLLNWQLEAEKLLDRYRIFLPMLETDKIPADDEFLMVITNYERAIGRREQEDRSRTILSQILMRTWDVAIFDENPHLENPYADLLNYRLQNPHPTRHDDHE